jgi:hypothetical protein
MNKKVYKATVEFYQKYEFEFAEDELEEAPEGAEEQIKAFVEEYLAWEHIPESFEPIPIEPGSKEFIKIELVDSTEPNSTEAQ